MNIEFDKKTIEHLNEKEVKDITVEIKSHPTCGGMSYSPVVILEKPDREKEYNLVTKEGINVYLSEKASQDGELIKILYKKFGIIERYMALYY